MVKKIGKKKACTFTASATRRDWMMDHLFISRHGGQEDASWIRFGGALVIRAGVTVRRATSLPCHRCRPTISAATQSNVDARNMYQLFNKKKIVQKFQHGSRRSSKMNDARLVSWTPRWAFSTSSFVRVGSTLLIRFFFLLRKKKRDDIFFSFFAYLSLVYITRSVAKRNVQLVGSFSEDEALL